MGPGGLTGELLSNDVIDDECVTSIVRLGDDYMVDKGTVLVNYLLRKNNLGKYEDFLNVWETTHSADANNLRVTIHNALTSQGLGRWVPSLPSVTSSTAASNCQAPTSVLQSKSGSRILLYRRDFVCKVFYMIVV